MYCKIRKKYSNGDRKWIKMKLEGGGFKTNFSVYELLSKHSAYFISWSFGRFFGCFEVISRRRRIFSLKKAQISSISMDMGITKYWKFDFWVFREPFLARAEKIPELFDPIAMFQQKNSRTFVETLKRSTKKSKSSSWYPPLRKLKTLDIKQHLITKFMTNKSTKMMNKKNQIMPKVMTKDEPHTPKYYSFKIIRPTH